MHADHHSDGYSSEQLELLREVNDFSGKLAELGDAGYDLTGLADRLDPDPIRYIWVDEGREVLRQLTGSLSTDGAHLPRIEGFERVKGREIGGRATAPAIAYDLAADEIVASWLRWLPGEGEVVMVGRAPAKDISGAWDEETAISGPPGDCYRPRVAIDPAGHKWIAYSRGYPVGSPPGLYVVRDSEPRQWGEPELVSSGRGAAFNPEIAAGEAGIALTWQQFANDGVHIMARVRDSVHGWGPVTVVDEDDHEAFSAWDPAVACLPDGSAVVVWSCHHGDSYRLASRTITADAIGPVRHLTDGTDYALHPSLASDAAGRLYCAFDHVTIQGHAGSGPTRLVPVASSAPPATVKPDGLHFPRDMQPSISSRVRVVEIGDDSLAEAATPLAAGFSLSPNAMPRLIAAPDGSLAVAYRVLRKLPLIRYFWEVVVQALGPAGWSGPRLLTPSDGPPEEPALAAGPDGILVAWQSDSRRSRMLEWTEGWGGSECPFRSEHYGEVVWHELTGYGSLHVASLTTHGPAARLPATVAPIASSQRQEARPWPPTARRPRATTEVRGVNYALYWGDLHRHSLVSRCTVGDEPDLGDYYHYARDVAQYDFIAITDHAENTGAYQWWQCRKLADLFDVPGTLTALKGFEWTAKSGHMNVIYGSTPRDVPIYSAFARGSNTPGKLWAALRETGHPAVTIPHHTASAMTPYSWENFDPDYVRLVEIFQACRGNYEDQGCFRQYRDATSDGNFVIDGLRRGHQFGFIASTDHGYGSAYLGVFARSLDRAGIFEALHARRAFAATTRDIRLELRAGDLFMGECGRSALPVRLMVSAAAYTDLARIDIVRNGECVWTVTPPSRFPRTWDMANVRVEWLNASAEAAVDWSGRLHVQEGEVRVPQFVDPAVESITQGEVRWRETTPGFGPLYGAMRGGIEVTLAGPAGAMVTVETGPGSLRVPLRDLSAGRRSSTSVPGGELAIGPATGSLTSLGYQSAELTHEDRPAGASWYYARAILVDGEMAWTSPIWIEAEV